MNVASEIVFENDLNHTNSKPVQNQDTSADYKTSRKAGSQPPPLISNAIHDAANAFGDGSSSETSNVFTMPNNPSTIPVKVVDSRSAMQESQKAKEGVTIPGSAFATVALMKGITILAISSAIGAPVSAIENFFAGKQNALRQVTVHALAKILGVDMITGRLASDQVHVFNLCVFNSFHSKKSLSTHLNSFAELFKGSKAVNLDFACMSNIKRSMTKQVHVIQSSKVRAIFLGANKLQFSAEFDPEMITGVTWLTKNKKTSVVKVYQPDLVDRVLKADITPVEFDELFDGKKATTWSDIQNMARISNVSKKEIIAWLESKNSLTLIANSRDNHLLDSGRQAVQEIPYPEHSV